MSTGTTVRKQHPSDDAGEAVDEREVVIRRDFAVPARLLFAAYSTPEQLRQWFGPVGWPMTLCEVDFRVGGRFRFALTGPDGKQGTPFGGEYREIEPDRRIVYDNGFETRGAERMLVTVTFVEHGEVTTLTIRTRFTTAAMKRAYVDAGFAGGILSGLNQLTGVVAAMLAAESS